MLVVKGKSCKEVTKVRRFWNATRKISQLLAAVELTTQLSIPIQYKEFDFLAR
jgi:hypothetical protein